MTRFNRFNRFSALVAVVAASAHGFEVGVPYNGGFAPQENFSRIEGFQVVYSATMLGQLEITPTAPMANAPVAAASEDVRQLTNIVSAATNGDTKISIVPDLGSRAAFVPNLFGISDLRLNATLTPSEQFWAVIHELVHRDQTLNDGPLNFMVEGANSYSSYGHFFHASEAIAFATSQAAFGSIVINAATTHPEDVPGLISNYYDRDATNRLGTYNTTSGAVNTLLTQLANPSLVQQLLADSDFSVQLPNGGYFTLERFMQQSVSLSYSDGQSVRAFIGLDNVSTATAQEALNVIRAKLEGAQTYLAQITPNNAQDIAFRNQNDQAIQIAHQIIDNQLAIPIQTISTDIVFTNTPSTTLCVGGCALAGGMAGTTIKKPAPVMAQTVVGAKTNATVTAVRAAVTNASSGYNVCQRKPWMCDGQ